MVGALIPFMSVMATAAVSHQASAPDVPQHLASMPLKPLIIVVDSWAFYATVVLMHFRGDVPCRTTLPRLLIPST